MSCVYVLMGRIDEQCVCIDGLCVCIDGPCVCVDGLCVGIYGLCVCIDGLFVAIDGLCVCIDGLCVGIDGLCVGIDVLCGCIELCVCIDGLFFRRFLYSDVRDTRPSASCSLAGVCSETHTWGCASSRVLQRPVVSSWEHDACPPRLLSTTNSGAASSGGS